MQFLVYGKPVTQGSMVAVYNRRTQRASVRHVQSLPLAKWRRSIADAARLAGGHPTGLPVRVQLVFGMPRPALHLDQHGNIKLRYIDALPMHKDLDKLIRAVLDALTGVCFQDDKQVVELQAQRIYAPFTSVEVVSLAWPDAARMAEEATANTEARQLHLPLLREESE